MQRIVLSALSASNIKRDLKAMNLNQYYFEAWEFYVAVVGTATIQENCEIGNKDRRAFMDLDRTDGGEAIIRIYRYLVNQDIVRTADQWVRFTEWLDAPPKDIPALRKL